MADARRPIILLAESSDSVPLAWLQGRADVRAIGSTDANFSSELQHADGLLVRTYTQVNEELLSRAPKLRVVGRGGVGLENIDVAACRRRGIEVVYTPDANTLAVGDFVFGLILQLIRPWNFFGMTPLESRDFKKIRDTVRGKQLNELTIGILGMGRVGRRVGHIASLGFGMRVIYNDLLNVHAHLNFPATSVDKPTLYREADIVSMHVTMLPGNENIVGREQIAMMKPGSVLLNTSRGEALDAAALADAIRSKHLAGAALDVYHPEPPGKDFPLLGFENVLLSPHLAARTFTAMDNMSWVVRDVMEVLEGRPAKFPAP